jgi:malate dehydrogenase (oxaloacetate-decarboxylating)
MPRPSRQNDGQMSTDSDDFGRQSLLVHEQLGGKIATQLKMPLRTRDDLSIAYTPGVAEPCRAIADDPEKVWSLTIKRNTVAVVTDGSAVLGLGNIGPHAALPVMEGKAMLFREFAGIDAWPICLDTQDVDEIVETVRRIAPAFGGVNLEDISAPRCFAVEDALQDLGIPVFHDDQHGTAVVLLAALLNACRVLGRDMADLRLVVNGAGAAGTAIAKLLHSGARTRSGGGVAVRDVIVCDTQGAIHRERPDLTAVKRELAAFTNRENRSGTVQEVLADCDVFIGVSKADLLTTDDLRRMAPNPVILALANPVPEIMPDLARAAGAAIVGTGRSDFPNQVNNVLAFPGIFRGALDARAPYVSAEMKLAAAEALAASVTDLGPEHILPDPLDRSVAPRVAEAVRAAAPT